ncbi:precorrin-2 dehydrogenase/sirohydrochlorin ferrochelatase family protein [Halomicrobium katesii]|uniref:precorrin-2 dehydrogenase/sirohydrochlorin ferrochelatase family protein n=1 Tax=Halomicrobium katesii TaxID=437163 RepID=UPI000366A193|nr:bifunctional precorrin-2 dehydrogenase/sirohydrochlorin ferrochelatase [Halomicrobium katesii]
MLPLMHDFTDETVLVFGGGPVGARKARRFDREADVIVVSPDFADRGFGDAERVRAAPDAAAAADWIGRTRPALVVAATDDAALNEAIADAARDQGALVNRTDVDGDREMGSVVVPATVRDGPVTVAVATGGTSPALSKHLRERFETEFAGVGELAAVTGELRTELKARGVSPTERRDAIRAAVRSRRVWKALDSPGGNTRQVVTDVIDEHTGDLS